jgi:hypothetical protein
MDRQACRQPKPPISAIGRLRLVPPACAKEPEAAGRDAGARSRIAASASPTPTLSRIQAPLARSKALRATRTKTSSIPALMNLALFEGLDSASSH